MLQRIVTGLTLGLLTIAVIFYAPIWLAGMVAALFISAAAVEWLALCQYRHWAIRISYLIVLWLVGWGAYYIWWYLSVALVLIWLGLIALVIIVARHKKPFPLLQSPKTLLPLGIILLASSWAFFVKMQMTMPLVLFYGILVVSIGDSGAYFVGRKLGRSPLAQNISPKKTIEGFCGQLVVSIIAGMAVVIFMNVQHPAAYLAWFITTLLLVVISVFGDLFESLLKRMNNIKDSGSILPGHGGVLDRLDSIIAMMPFLVMSQFLWHSLFY